MKLPKEVEQRISETVIDILYEKLNSLPEGFMENRNAPFHESFLQAFSEKLENIKTNSLVSTSLSSWPPGLNTCIDQTFFERVAHAISCGEKREFTTSRDGLLHITQAQNQAIYDIITDLSNLNLKPDLKRELELIPEKGNDPLLEAQGFSADVYCETDDKIVAIELKSVKPNSGEMKGEKLKILFGRTALKNKYPQKSVEFYIAFPFDPTVDTSSASSCSYDKSRFLNNIVNGNKFFDQDEVLLASEFWDFLSGQPGTMQEILDIINSIATPRFMDKYNVINSFDGDYSDEIVHVLEEWHLYTELDIFRNCAQIKEIIAKDKRLMRTYHQRILKPSYNKNRFDSLIGLLR
ncbi:MAG: TdeIII family type II restriction endonuclease [Candidatus Cloacimonadaceae bacterium]|jgi:hypothetical protein|nr:TdeIII family type II restriction endonuclease [Candidatus Cloacimonadota bacterium]MCK9242505.1 TdeIII family type II restriction endonuclease [Candidatus Cloacimonadota bacterium]MDD3102942.1 TdeIII family type II restriction endonuclease [Candidatus Cloacimonadota bacterium]MDD3533159.1 TdeIII family type II restriction endonuclease [Candidatus Cloacimonadota bacterium]MDY0127795.1 TdeIII family type II restriction endonuclease [Candidatus Cloacimonadaceae bacterium]